MQKYNKNYYDYVTNEDRAEIIRLRQIGWGWFLAWMITVGLLALTWMLS